MQTYKRTAPFRGHDTRVQNGKGRIGNFRNSLLTGITVSVLAFGLPVYADDFPEDAPETSVNEKTDELLAQTADEGSDEEIITLEPVTIDAKADVITGGVQLEAEDLDRIDPETLRDVFRQEPGVTVGSPISLSQKIYVNGVEDSNLAVDIDGARQANKTYHHIGTTVVDPGLLKAVKIESGVAPADAGPRALGGSISLETKDGRDFVEGQTGFGGFGKVAYNSNTQGFAEDLALGARASNFDVLAYGTHADGDDYEDGTGSVVEGTRPASTNFIGKIGYTADNGYRVKFAATRYDDEATRDARANFSLPDTFGTAWQDYHRQQFTLSFGDETPSAMWDPVFSISSTEADYFTEQSTRGLYANVESINAKAQNTFQTEFGDVTVGVDYFSDEGTGGYTNSTSGRTDLTEEVENYGAYIQDRMTVTDEMRLSFGARFDSASLTGQDDSKFTEDGFSGNINAEYDFSDNITGYGGASTVFGGLPLGEVGILDTDTSYDGMQESRSKNVKIGAVVTYAGFTIDGHIYRTSIDNAHDLDGETRGNSIDLVSEGQNLTVRYDYMDGFVRAGFSNSDVTVDGSAPSTTTYYLGRPLGEKVTMEAHHTFAPLDVTLGTTNEWVLESHDVQDRNGEAIDGYVVSNVYASWTPEMVPGLTGRFDVFNLFDRTYADRANAGSDSANANVSAIKEPGRTFLASLKMDF